MEQLSFPVLSVILSKNAIVFVDNWAKMYNYPGYHRYEELLRLTAWKYDDLLELFTWKNGMPLSGKKVLVFERYIAAHIDSINQLRTHFDKEKFDRLFFPLSAIWRIFLLHIVNPRYPIFDQHVYRAMIYIRQQNFQELPQSKAQRMRIYHEEYLSFFSELKACYGGYSEKVVDNALWAFGRFLKEHYILF
jgi:hypothetical protein